MEPTRSVLYLDFDNVFGALLTLDPRSALQFAEEPGLWLERLSTSFADENRRRWLVLRCYMNPSGSVSDPSGNGPRIYFSRFRPFFTDAGFEVVDCPRLSHSKNGADIRMVIDAVEALGAPVHYEEFVIASGDSDMTPLIVRLRAADRRTTLVSPSDSAAVLGAVADRLIGGEEFLELIDTKVDTAAPDAHEAPHQGAITNATATPAAGVPLSVPEPVDRIASLLRVKMLPRESWPQIYSTLAEFVATNDFNLSEATRWTRDRLLARETAVPRLAVSQVAHGAAYGGCPLYRQPPPGADEIAEAFVANLIGRATDLNVELSPDDVSAVRAWFGASATA